MPQENPKNRRCIIYINISSTRAKRDEKIHLWSGLTAKRHTIWSRKLDNRLPQNVQDIRRNHEAYEENQRKVEGGIDSRKKRFSSGKNPEWYIPGRFALTITTMLLNHKLKKCTCGYKLSESQEKINH